MMRRRVWIALLLIAAWSIPGLLAASFNVVLFPAVRREGTLLYIGVQVAYWWIWVALTPVVVAVTRRYPLERTQLRTSLPMHVLALLGCTLIYTLWYTGVGKTLLPTMGTPESFLQLLRGSIGGRMALGPLLYAAVVGMTVAVDERTRRREHDLHTARLQAELAKAQLQALQMQLQPHFLFNTLHTISMLIEENPPAATRTIVLLGDLLRQTLALADVAEVSLGEELGVLQRYLDIEAIRFGDRLTVIVDVPAEIRNIQVPSFLLQPLVENAVRHGVAPRVEPGRVTVRARCDGDVLCIDVEDDGAGFRVSPPHAAGIGLTATRERLAVLYGSRAHISCADARDGGARVTVTIPVRHG